MGAFSLPSIDIANLISLTKTVRKRVPIIDFAIAVAVAAIVGSIVVSRLGYNINAVLVVGFVFIAMILMIGLAQIVVQPSHAVRYAGVFLLWVVALCFCCFIIFGTTAIIFGFPGVLYNRMLGIVVAPTVIVPANTKNENEWADVEPVSQFLTTANHHCSSDCRGEPTRTPYRIDLKVPPGTKGPARLANVKLECVSGACAWSEVHSTTLSPDGQIATANLDVWGNPSVWKLSATLQTAK